MKMALFVLEERSANRVMIAMRVCCVEDERDGDGGGGEMKEWNGLAAADKARSLKGERLTAHCGKSRRLAEDSTPVPRRM